MISLIKTFLIIVFSVTILSCQNANHHTVKFLVKSDSIEDSNSVFITGNNLELGNWNPAKIKLRKTSHNTWMKKISFPKGIDLLFKFTKGSWETEALNKNNEVPGNHSLKVISDTTIVFEIQNWKSDLFKSNKLKGQITGEVKYHKNLTWDGLLDRDIIVWLPPNYNRDLNNHYPVLYMHDGQNIFDPATSSFGTDWQIDEAADSLIKNNTIEPIIIVGIYNTINRNNEYNNTDTSKIYMDFIINKVKPLIDKTYRTKPGRKYTSTGGSSSGGLISFMLLWEHSEIFSKAICMSPAFKIFNIDYNQKVNNYNGDKKEIKIYLDNGGIELEEKLQPGISEMIEILLGKGFQLNTDLFWVKEKDAQHNEAAWAKRIPNVLKQFYGK